MPLHWVSIFRPANNYHNYEYPNLPARPSSETALSLNEKCQNYINSSNFDDGKSNVDSVVVDEASRRISAASGAPLSLESVSFEGPISGKSKLILRWTRYRRCHVTDVAAK